MQSDRLIYYILMGSFVVGVVALVGIWYLLLFVVAAAVFIAVIVATRKKAKSVPLALEVDPSVEIPLKDWVEPKNATVSTGADLFEFRLVNFENYRSSWRWFIEHAQVETGDRVRIEATMYCAQESSSGLSKIFIAYKRKILAEIPMIDVESIFNSLLSAGGIFRVPCEFLISEHGEITSATMTLSADSTSNFGEKPEIDLYSLWVFIWRGIRGKQ